MAHLSSSPITWQIHGKIPGKEFSLSCHTSLFVLWSKTHCFKTQVWVCTRTAPSPLLIIHPCVLFSNSYKLESSIVLWPWPRQWPSQWHFYLQLGKSTTGTHKGHLLPSLLIIQTNLPCRDPHFVSCSQVNTVACLSSSIAKEQSSTGLFVDRK